MMSARPAVDGHFGIQFGVPSFVREHVGVVTGSSTRFVLNNAAFSDDLEGYASISHQLI